MKFLENLRLDTWWKVVLYLGVGAVVCSFFLRIDFLEAKHLFGLGVGMFFVGMSYWMAEKHLSTIKPPNAYTGPAAWISWKETRHNPITVILLLIGLGLLGLFGVLIIKNLI